MAEELKKRIVRKAGGLAYDLTRPEVVYIYELVRAEDGLCFCCYNGKEFFRLDTIEQIDHVVYPPPEQKVTWLLPKLIEGSGNPSDSHPLFTRQVWDGVNQFIRDHLDLTDDRLYTYLTAWVFASWFQDKLSASPYPYFTGLKRSGKTRALEVLRSLCFRAKGLAGISAAAIRTNIRLLQPTLLIDEADFEDEEKRGELFSILLSYRPDMYVERKNPKAAGWDQLEVDPAYCFKAIASRKPPSTNLADRCIQICMRYRSRKVKRLNSKVSQERAEKLRTELMEIRMRFYHQVSDVDVDFQSVEDDRVAELFTPVYVMAKNFAGEEETEKIKKLAVDVEASFERERRRSDAKDIVEAICALVDEKKAELKMDKYILPTSLILDKVNEKRHETMKISARLHASILDSIGFERDDVRYGGKEGKTLKCVIFDEKTLEHYRKLFKIGEESPKKPSLQEALEQVRAWLVQNKDADGLVEASALANYISELGFEPAKIIKTLKDEYVVFDVPKIGKLGVK